MSVKTPNEIVFDNGSVREKLSLAYAPLATSILVQSAREDVLQTINLKELFKNLNTCVPLLNITYNAVNGTGLSSTVTGLKDKFPIHLKKVLLL